MISLGFGEDEDAPVPPPAPPEPTAEDAAAERLRLARVAHDALMGELEVERAMRPEPCPF